VQTVLAHLPEPNAHRAEQAGRNMSRRVAISMAVLIVVAVMLISFWAEYIW
jgi:hypothetical protein